MIFSTAKFHGLSPPEKTGQKWREKHIYFLECVLCWEAGGNTMKDLLLVLGVAAGWFVLQRYILPRLGVPT